jgi:hypothetical protein
MTRDEGRPKIVAGTALRRRGNAADGAPGPVVSHRAPVVNAETAP